MKCLLCLFGAILPFSSFAVTFQVTSTADSGPGTLRQAILDANLTPGRDDISFNLAGPGPYVILPLNALPTITDPVAIDGSTQPGFSGKPMVELRGSLAGAGANGLWITAGNSLVRSLIINRFEQSGILIQSRGSNGIVSNVVSGNSSGGIRLQSASDNVLEGNNVGTDVAGSAGLGNGSHGIILESAANRNTIGGSSAGAGNLVSANQGNGIYAIASSDNVVEGNIIGTDVTGSLALANALCGVNLLNAATNTIGGTTAAARNLISGNGVHGIEIGGSGSQANVVQGNYIGVDRGGTLRIANRGSGIYLAGSLENLIGGDEPGARNIISGSFNNGIQLVFAHSNSIAGNFIGVDVSGASPIRNSFYGVQLENASFNTIGSTDPAGRNIISGNLLGGIIISSSGRGNVIQGNFIGTDVSGSKGVGNSQSGVILSAAANTIGGEEPGAGNVISANQTAGVRLGGSSNVLQGNFIGVDASGTRAVPNGTNDNFHAGVIVTGSDHTIGGTASTAANVIAGNLGHGILVQTAARCVVEGNYIGVNATGGRVLGNSRNGLVLDGAAAPARQNIIGGPDAGNLIGGNGLAGIRISSSVSNIVQGNAIGIAGDMPLPNRAIGIELVNSSMDNFIGGTASGEGNRIAYNSDDGISVEGINTRRNAIRGNSIFANGGLGVDLRLTGEAPHTPTPNDPTDADSGPNALQNFPIITNVVYTGSSSVILQGFLRSTPDASFELDFFSNARNEPSGFGEGEGYLGTTAVDTDSSGFAEFSWVRSGSFSNQYFTATATDLDTSNTSEFSPAAGGLRITQISHGGGNISVSFTTLPGRQHRLEFATSLSGSPNWQAVPGGENVSGTGAVVTIEHVGVSGSSTLFYRVRLF